MSHDGEVREIYPYELFRIRSLLAGIYHSELSNSIVTIGYQIDEHPTEGVEIKGYSEAYLSSFFIPGALGT
jgi:hypothetical protein